MRNIFLASVLLAVSTAEAQDEWKKIHETIVNSWKEVQTVGNFTSNFYKFPETSMYSSQGVL